MLLPISATNHQEKKDFPHMCYKITKKKTYNEFEVEKKSNICF